jgi:hypothetical protein
MIRQISHTRSFEISKSRRSAQISIAFDEILAMHTIRFELNHAIQSMSNPSIKTRTLGMEHSK